MIPITRITSDRFSESGSRTTIAAHTRVSAWHSRAFNAEPAIGSDVYLIPTAVCRRETNSSWRAPPRVPSRTEVA